MAEQAQINGVLGAFDILAGANLDHGLRKELGNQSIYDTFAPRITQLASTKQLVAVGAKYASGQQCSDLQNQLGRVLNSINRYATMTPADFMQQRQALVNELDTALSDTFSLLSQFVIWYIYENWQTGFSSSEQSLQAKFEELKKSNADAIGAIKQQADETIARAQQIEATARQTAKEVSLDISKGNFSGLRRRFFWGSATSGIAGLSVFMALLWYLWSLQQNPHPFSNIEDTISNAIIRIAFIAVIGALGAVLLKVFRGNLNMYYHTLHREHLATIAQTFVQAGETPEQRGIVFAKIVDAVASFGNSGLIGGKDDGPTLNVVNDLIPKMLGKSGEGASH
jgi:hypothetical protein